VACETELRRLQENVRAARRALTEAEGALRSGAENARAAWAEEQEAVTHWIAHEQEMAHARAERRAALLAAEVAS